MTLLKTLNSQVKRIVASPTCLSCHASTKGGAELCAACIAALSPLRLEHCNICATPFEGQHVSSHRCAACLKKAPSFKKVTSAFEYSGTALTLLHRAKFGKSERALKILCLHAKDIFLQQVSEFKPHYLIPVPLSYLRGLLRGFNQSHLVTRHLQLAALTDIPIFEGISRRHTTAQAKKDFKSRTRILKGVFSANNTAVLKEKRILIIDDVLTTGATVEALIQAIKKSGFEEARVFTLARA